MSRIRSTLNTGIAALAIGAAAIALAPTPAAAFSLGGFRGGFGHIGGLGHTGSLGHVGGGLGHTDTVGHNSFANVGRGTTPASRLSEASQPEKTVPKSEGNTSAKNQDSHSDSRSRDRNDYDRPHGRGLDTPIVTDDTPIFTPRPVIADGRGDQAVANPCKDKVLLVETSKAECVNDVVTISGTKYYYCRTTKEIEEKAYSFPAVPKQACSGTDIIDGEWLPEGYTRPIYEERGRCKETGSTLIQYSPEAGKWMKITWKIYRCKNGETQQETERLDNPQRESTDVKASDPPPVKPGDTVVPSKT